MTAPLGAEPIDVLGGRLRIQLPRGYERDAPFDKRGAASDASPLSEERVYFRVENLSISVSEEFRFAGAHFADDVAASVRDWDTAPSVEPLRSHATGVLVVASKVLPPYQPSDYEMRLDQVADAYVAHPDGTVLDVSVDVFPGADLAACTEVAKRVLATIETGPRRLELAAGERRLPGILSGEVMLLDVPEGFVASTLHSNIFHRAVHKVIPFDKRTSPRLVITAGGSDAEFEVAETPPPSARMFGQKLVWLRDETVHGTEEIFLRADGHYPSDSGGVRTFASIRAPDAASAEELKRIAQTIRIVKADEPRRDVAVSADDRPARTIGISIAESNEKRYIRHVRSEPSHSSPAAFVDALAARGRYDFTTEEATRAFGSSAVAARAALRRLAGHGRIAMPVRGFHVIVPPEYRQLGCLPPEQFVPQLLARLKLRYYVALLSAAQYHGAAHHRPQTFQVAVAVPRRPIECGSVEVEFIARKDVVRVPTKSLNTPRGAMLVSSIEATAIDLIGYVNHVGGLDQAATVIGELAEQIDGAALAKVAKTAPVSWSQRLGFLLDELGHSERAELLAAFVKKNAGDVIALSPSEPTKRTKSVARWRLNANVEVEAET